MDLSTLSDEDLRKKLISAGMTNVGPVTGTTRRQYEKKLQRLMSGGSSTTSPQQGTARRSPARTRDSNIDESAHVLVNGRDYDDEDDDEGMEGEESHMYDDSYGQRTTNDGRMYPDLSSNVSQTIGAMRYRGVGGVLESPSGASRRYVTMKNDRPMRDPSRWHGWPRYIVIGMFLLFLVVFVYMLTMRAVYEWGATMEESSNDSGKFE